jgi:predicted dehydrogenase
MLNLKTRSAVRWGILGTGNIAGQFARDLPLARDVELLAVASRTFERARAFAREHGVPRAYGRYDDLAADPDIDAVYIGTPMSATMKTHGCTSITANTCSVRNRLP